jgi:hypothetical protein
MSQMSSGMAFFKGTGSIEWYNTAAAERIAHCGRWTGIDVRFQVMQ